MAHARSQVKLFNRSKRAKYDSFWTFFYCHLANLVDSSPVRWMHHEAQTNDAFCIRSTENVPSKYLNWTTFIWLLCSYSTELWQFHCDTLSRMIEIEKTRKTDSHFSLCRSVSDRSCNFSSYITWSKHLL